MADKSKEGASSQQTALVSINGLVPPRTQHLQAKTCIVRPEAMGTRIKQPDLVYVLSSVAVLGLRSTVVGTMASQLSESI